MLTDTLLLIFLGLAGMRGYKRGLIGEAFQFVGLAAGLLMALYMGGWMSIKISKYVGEGPWLPFAGFVALFLIVYSAVALAGKALEKGFEAIGTGFINRIGGAAFAVIRYGFFISLIMWLAVRLGIAREETMQNGYARSIIYPLAPWMIEQVSQYWPQLKEWMEEISQMLKNRGGSDGAAA